MNVYFPSIGGYPKMSTFGTVVGERSAEGREEFLRYYTSAIEVPSPAISAIERISKESGVFLVVGIIEKDGGTLYCTAIFVDPIDGYLAKHRKLMPTAAERLIWGLGDGSTLPVLSKSFSKEYEKEAVTTKLSATICWSGIHSFLFDSDAVLKLCLGRTTCHSVSPVIAQLAKVLMYALQVRTYYYSKGTELYCAPTVDARPVWQHTMRHIAIEGRCFVLSACQYSREQDYPADHAVREPDNRKAENVMIAGGSVIINPLGEVLAGPLLDQEGVLVADLDLDDVIRGKFDLDVVGHYARPDGET